MEILLMLMVASFIISGGFLIAFIWNVKSGQFDDTYGPSQKILFEDSISTKEINPTKNN
ncbi:MAG: cbb3-type cytochrome oxidase assembly protein CcoS [Chitinophagales bacterium]|nr:cbb3-type cytochrome oxidase assembly protein CcoS [Chitinophagales bacterium]